MSLIDCIIKNKINVQGDVQGRIKSLTDKGMAAEEAEATVKNQIINEQYEAINKEVNKLKKAVGLPTEKVNRVPLVGFEDVKKGVEPPKKKPPTTDTSKKSDSKSPGVKAILDRILKSDTTKPAIKRGIEEKGASYIPKGLDLTLAEAEALIELYGDKADLIVRDLSNGITPDARVNMTAKLYEKYVAEGKVEEAVDIAMWQAEYSLQAGRAGNAAKIWKMITQSGEEAIVLAIEKGQQKNIEQAVEPVREELSKTMTDIEAEIRRQVESRVQKEVEGRLAKAKLITKEKRKEIADFFDGLKVDTSNKGMLNASVIPGISLLPHVWNASVDIMKQAILTGADVANAIQAGLDYIKANQKEAIDEEKFKEFMAPKLDALVPKEPIKREAIDDDKIKTPKNLKGRKKKEFIDEVVNAINDGKFDDKKLEELYAKKVGVKTLTTEDRAKIRELAKIIDKAEKFEKDLRDGANPFDKSNVNRYKELLKDAQKANSLLQEFSSKPNSIEDTLISIMQGNALSSMSLVANVFYNVNLQPLRFSSTVFASIFDLLISKLAKFGILPKALEDRSINLIALQKGWVKGGWNGTAEGVKQLYTGPETDIRNLREIQSNFNPRRAMQRWAEENRTTSQKVNDYIEGTIGWEAEVMFRLLNLGDKPWRRAAEMARAFEIAEKKGLKGKDLQKFLLLPDIDSAIEIKKAGDEATFQQEGDWGKFLQSGVAKILDKLSKFPIVGKPIKVLAKSQLLYIKTPWNVIAEVMQFATPPVTFAMGINEVSKGNKRTGVDLMGKAVVGAMIQAVAYQLFIKGLLTGDDDKEKKKRQFQQDGTPAANSINISAIGRGLTPDGSWETKDGDTWVSYQKMGVTGVLFDSYANTYKERQQEGIPILTPDTYIYDMITSGPKIASASLDQTFLSGTSKLLNAVRGGGNEDTDRWLISTAETLGVILLPNVVATASKATDEYIRDVKDDSFWNELNNVYKAKLFMGNDLPAKVSIWGERITGEPDGRNKAMYYLFDPSKFKNIQIDDFRYKLYQEFKKDGDGDWIPGAPSRKFTVNKESGEFNPKQYELLSIYIGQERANESRAYINSDEWNSDDTEKKKDKLKSIYREAATAGREKMLTDMGYNLLKLGEIKEVKDMEKLKAKIEKMVKKLSNEKYR